jgi:pimeloyl-ACP methyl ester carboxylesterase
MDYRGRGRSDWAADHTTYAIPIEARDALELLDHLGIAKAAILGTSRGGLIAMGLAATAPDRLLGVCLNDVGPVLETAGLDKIKDYLGRNPAFATHADMAAKMPIIYPEFQNVPPARWTEDVTRHFNETPEGLKITYDPKLRDAVLNALQPEIDLWPFFEALRPFPTALIRGANSDLLSAATADEMSKRHPNMLRADVPGRGHIPFLDEPESLAVIEAWSAQL